MANTEQQIILMVNGTPTASQNTANFLAGQGVTITPVVGGGILFTFSGGITPGSLFPYSGVPTGSIPGSVFTVPFTLVALITVFVNGLALLPSSYTQSGTTFTLTTPLVATDTIFISGLYSS